MPLITVSLLHRYRFAATTGPHFLRFVRPSRESYRRHFPFFNLPSLLSLDLSHAIYPQHKTRPRKRRIATTDAVARSTGDRRWALSLDRVRWLRRRTAEGSGDISPHPTSSCSRFANGGTAGPPFQSSESDSERYSAARWSRADRNGNRIALCVKSRPIVLRDRCDGDDLGVVIAGDLPPLSPDHVGLPCENRQDAMVLRGLFGQE